MKDILSLGRNTITNFCFIVFLGFPNYQDKKAPCFMNLMFRRPLHSLVRGVSTYQDFCLSVCVQPLECICKNKSLSKAFKCLQQKTTIQYQMEANLSNGYVLSFTITLNKHICRKPGLQLKMAICSKKLFIRKYVKFKIHIM